MSNNQKKFIINKSNENELTGFQKFELKLKESIFGVLYSLIKDDYSGVLQTVILSLIELCQILAFSFHPFFWDSWGASNKTFVKAIYDGLIKLHIVNYLESDSQLIYLLIYYSIVILLLFFIADIIYVAYCFNRGFFSSIWPVYILRKGVRYLVAVLFFPFFRLFISVFQCDNSSMMHIYAKDMACYTGFHYLHLFIGIISSLTLVGIDIIVAKTYYQCNNNICEDINAKNNSRGDVFQVFTKVVLTFLFTFLDTGVDFSSAEASNLGILSWIVIIILNFLSVWQFSTFYFEDPYANKYFQLYFSCLNAIYMWTNFVLIISKLLTYWYAFEGSVYAWAAGVPLVVLIIVFHSHFDNSITLLNKNLNKLNKGEEIERQMRILMRLIMKKGKDRESEVILKGFIRNHDETCIFSECPLKTLKRVLQSGGDLNTKGEGFNKDSTVNMLLFTYVTKIFIIGLSKFPNCASLRVAYALFLYNQQKQKYKARNELESAEKNHPSLDQQFIIFTFKKMINDDQDMLSGTANLEALDLQSSVAYDSHFRQCQSSILLSSRLFLDFWSLLSNTNSTPDIYKLNLLGEKINDCLKNIINHWNRMQHYKPNDPKALKMYSLFCKEILNNKERAKEIMALSKGTSQNKRESHLQDIEMEYEEEFARGCTIFCLSAENENFGFITKITGNASKIFGYLPNDICGRSFDELFADCYNGYVTSFLRDHIANRTEQKDLKEIEEFEFFGKARTSRILPIYLKVLHLNKSVNEKMQLKILVRADNSAEDNKMFTRYAYYIVNANMQISLYSDSANELLAIVQGKTNSDNSNLITCFPELIREDLMYNAAMSYKITDSALIDLVSTDSTSAKDFFLKIRNMKKFSSMRGFNFYNLDYSEDEKPLYAKIKISPLNDQFLIKEDKDRESLMKSGEDSLLMEDSKFPLVGKLFSGKERASVDINNSIVIATSSESTAPKNNNVAINYDSLYETYKDRMFGIKIEYSLSHKIAYKHLNEKIIGNDQGKISSVMSSYEPILNHNFRCDMIESPNLNIPIKSILNSIETPAAQINDIAGDSEKLERGEKPSSISNNLMSYIKDKGKFSFFFDFEGLDFLKEYSKQPNAKKYAGKTLQELKNMPFCDEAEDNGNKAKEFNSPERAKPSFDRDPISQKTSKFGGVVELNNSTHNKAQDEKDNNPSQEASGNETSEEDDDYNSNEYSQDSDVNVAEEEESEYYEDALDLLNTYTDMDYNLFKMKLENLQNFGKGISVSIYQNDAVIPQESSCPQILVRIKYEEDVLKEAEIAKSKQAKKVKETENVQKEDKKNQTPQSLSRLQLSSFITLLILLIFDIVDFIFNANANSTTQMTFNMIAYSYEAINHIVWSSYLVRNLLLSTNQNYTNYLYEDGYSAYYKMNIDALTTAYVDLDSIIKNMSQCGLELLPEHQEMFDTPNVPIYFLNDLKGDYQIEFRTLIQSMTDMRVYILTMANYPKESLYNNTLVNNLLYNSFNDFLSKLQSSSSMYSNLLNSNNEFYKTLFTILFAIIIIISIIDVLVMSIFLMKVDQDRSKILCAFYEIPQDYINELSKNCLKFIEKNEKPKTDEETEEQEEETGRQDTVVEDYEMTKKSNQRRRNLKNVNKNRGRDIVLKISLTFLIVIVFFLANFAKNSTLYADLYNINDVFNITARAESEYTLALNIEREKFLNLDFMVKQSNGLIILNKTLENIYALNNEILVKNIKTKKFFSSEFVDSFNQILNGNLCNLTEYTSSSQFNASCANELNGVAKYGLEIMLSRFFEFLRITTLEYIQIDISQDKMTILSGELLKKLTLFVHYFIKPMTHKITFQMKQNIDSILSSEFSFRMIIFISFMVFFVLGYLIIWLPYQNKLHDEIIRTKKMLEIIPSGILEKMESLKQ